ncbi:MAG: DUF1214 domain-containing protein [Acidimicrobiia bacterium]
MTESREPGDAWASWCTKLGELGRSLADDRFPQDAAGRAEGYRHLARQTVLALQGELEHADPEHPSFHRYEEPWAQWGGPNPDNVYVRAPIDPTATYRVWADVTGLRQALFSLVDGDMHLGRFGVFGERTLDEFAKSPDGLLEFWISPDEQPGNWVPTDPAARYLLIRQFQLDWEHDAIARFSIERLDSRGLVPELPATQTIAAAFDRAAAWTARSLDYWAAYVDGSRRGLPHNGFVPPSTPPGGAPNIAYGAGWWALAAHEALVITTDVPDADYWGWTIHTRYWLDSGEFADRQTSLNAAQTHVDGDGRIRVVVAGRDPGAPNWIDVEGRPEGLLVYRYVGARTRPVPTAELVPLADVRRALPDDHPVVDTATRREVLARRRIAAHRRYA